MMNNNSPDKDSGEPSRRQDIQAREEQSDQRKALIICAVFFGVFGFWIGRLGWRDGLQAIATWGYWIPLIILCVIFGFIKLIRHLLASDSRHH